MKRAHTVLIILIVIALGSVGWYLASPLFIDKVVNEDVIKTGAQQDSQTMLISQGSFVDADGFHKTKGTVKIVEKEGKKYVVLEDFEATNGPDLKVYLSDDTKASNYISLGELKGNKGNQQYELSLEENVANYEYALIWCEQFSVLFGSAKLE